MKKQLLLTTIVLALNFAAFSQKWLNFPSGTTNNRIDIGDLSVIGDSITVEALVTMQSTTYIPDAYDIVSKHLSPYDCSYLFRPDNFAIKTITDGFVGLASPIPLCMDSTYHVAGTYDGDSIKFFVNGKQVAAQHWTGTLFQNNYVVGIGNLTYTLGFNEQFTGYIDEVRIWGTARSQADISNNMYDLPNPTSQPGLLAYYKFNGDYKNAQGNSAFDGVTYGSDLLNANNPLFSGNVSDNFCFPTGIPQDNNSLSFLIYPNPTTDAITIENVSPFSVLHLFNAQGVLVKKQTILASSISLSVEDLPSGMYIIELQNNSSVQRAKFVKR